MGGEGVDTGPGTGNGGVRAALDASPSLLPPLVSLLVGVSVGMTPKYTGATVGRNATVADAPACGGDRVGVSAAPPPSDGGDGVGAAVGVLNAQLPQPTAVAVWIAPATVVAYALANAVAVA